MGTLKFRNTATDEWMEVATIQGPPGETGPIGPEGPEGKSAYETAVGQGFEGTEEAWLESLKGANGEDGVYVGETEPSDEKIKIWLNPAGTSGEEMLLPTGGTAGQVLVKKSETDYDTEWADQTGGSGGASTAADVAFDDTTAGIGADNVQAAIEHLADSGATTEVIQDMIDENLYNYYQSSSLLAVTEFKNASTVFTTGSDIFKRWRKTSNSQEYIYWDLDDAYYDDCTQKANIIGGLNNDIRVFSTALSYPNLKVTKGHYYKIYTIESYLTADDFYFDKRMIFAGNLIWSYNYENDTQRGRVVLLPQTKIMLLNTSGGYVSSAYPQMDELRALGLSNYGYIIIEDMTPVNQSQVDELAAKINSLVDGNEVSY